MVDISKCINEECPLKLLCYRYTAKANPHRQAYGSFQFKIVNGKTECEYFWSNKEYRNEREFDY